MGSLSLLRTTLNSGGPEHTKAVSDVPSAAVASFISEHNSNEGKWSNLSAKALHETFLPKELLYPGTINAMDALPAWPC